MANTGSDVEWITNTIDARQFLSTFLFLNFPLDVLGCTVSEEAINVRAATECIISCFYGMVDQLKTGARMLDVDQHLRDDFLKLLFDFLDKFRTWKTSDGQRLGEKVMVSLEKLHEVRLNGGLDDDQNRELATNIESLTAYYLRTNGPRALDAFNAKLQQKQNEKAAIALKTRAADTISRYWRFRFRTIKALAQAMVKHKIIDDDMVNLWCVVATPPLPCVNSNACTPAPANSRISSPSPGPCAPSPACSAELTNTSRTSRIRPCTGKGMPGSFSTRLSFTFESSILQSARNRCQPRIQGSKRRPGYSSNCSSI